MDEFELLVYLGALYCTYKFLLMWYAPLWGAWMARRGRAARLMLNLLPVAACAILLHVLTTLAASDVTGAPIYIVMYLLLGYAWLWLGMVWMRVFFDLSWLDDALHRHNPAALWATTGGFIGLTLIYAATNIGEGPGWWCVAVTGAMGLGAWFALGFLIDSCTGVFERVTVDRDTGAGIRIGCYLLASGILLGRASGGDWTSFGSTVAEFGAGWPVLPLALLVVLMERYFAMLRRDDPRGPGSPIFSSTAIGALYIALSVVAVAWILPPMP